jgi:hypothetical protein
MAAIFQSKNLVSGYGWVVFFRDLLVFLISTGISFFASFLPLGQILSDLIVRPFFCVFWFVFYKDLKKIKKDPQNWGSKKDKISIFLPFLLGILVIVALVILLMTKDQVLRSLKDFLALIL